MRACLVRSTRSNSFVLPCTEFSGVDLPPCGICPDSQKRCDSHALRSDLSIFKTLGFFLKRGVTLCSGVRGKLVWGGALTGLATQSLFGERWTTVD